MEQLHFSLLLFDLHSFIQIADIGNRNVAAAAASFDIINGSLSEQSDSGSLRQREQTRRIFQQYHSFSCCLSGQFDVLRTACYFFAAEGQIRLV